MNSEDNVVLEWFGTHMEDIVVFLGSLHVANLVNMYGNALNYKRHMLIPDHWPIESGWSFELLVAAIRGFSNNEQTQEAIVDWYNLENSDCQ